MADSILPNCLPACLAPAPPAVRQVPDELLALANAPYTVVTAQGEVNPLTVSQQTVVAATIGAPAGEAMNL